MIAQVICPTCGPMPVVADVYEHGKPISGICPECEERLYFADPSPPWTDRESDAQ